MRGQRAKASRRKRHEPTTSVADSPLTDGWQPRSEAAESLGTAFLKRCAGGERHLRHVLSQERETAIDAFDSGKPFEAAVRDELRRLLPARYAVRDGVLVDRNGLSGGHADAVIFNELWFMPVNAPTTTQPARVLMPIEGAYAVGEVKQRLTKETLEEAMEKLVIAQRLERPRTYANRLVENREADACTHGLTNPLFTFILAAEVDESNFQSIIGHWYDINKKLKRLEVVRCLCVLGAGNVSWGFNDPLRENELRPSAFHEG